VAYRRETRVFVITGKPYGAFRSVGSEFESHSDIRTHDLGGAAMGACRRHDSSILNEDEAGPPARDPAFCSFETTRATGADYAGDNQQLDVC
jgi:hypothetical protein